jgi:hypothetical protein
MIGRIHKPQNPENTPRIDTSFSLSKVDFCRSYKPEGGKREIGETLLLGSHIALTPNIVFFHCSSLKGIPLYVHSNVLNGLLCADFLNDRERFKCILFLSMVFSKNSGDFVNLHMKTLESIFHPTFIYRAINILHNSGVIEINKDYSPKAFSRKYAIAKDLRKGFFLARLDFPGAIIKSFREKMELGRKLGVKKMLDNAACPLSARKQYSFIMKCLKSVSLDEESLLEEKFRKKVEIVQSGDYWVRLKKNGRWFHNICFFPKILRNFIFIDGEQSIEIDYSNMQPWMAVKLYDKNNELHIVEMAKYASYCKSSFYERFKGLCGELANSFPNIKEEMYRQIFFGKYIPELYPLLKVFAAEFPILSKIIKNIKWENHKYLSGRLQKLESDIVIGSVMSWCMENKIKCIPIHDSIICKESDKERVREKMESAFFEVIGYEPTIK